MHESAPLTAQGATVSVIIPNYNYGDYVGAAIDSALNLDWPKVEVIVVDDGSTDHSRAVIASYGSRISALWQENAGHLAACNHGFSRSRGDIVVFLDSDDMLAPSLAREIAAVWTPRVSKVQVRMRVVDAAGRPTGSEFPQYEGVPSPEQVRAWAIRTSAYPTPPCSGNAYSRWFLERIFPLPETCPHTGIGADGRHARCRICSFSDSYCLAAAPLLGDVHTIPAPLVSYRVHGRNDGALSELDVHAFGREMTRALQRQAYARDVAAREGFELPERAINRSLRYLSYRLASLQLAPAEHPIRGDSMAQILLHLHAALFAPQGVSRKARLLLVAWAWAVAIAPAQFRNKLVLWRFAAGARPRALRAMLTGLGVIRT
jgi:glycosyltransferase involved in cell wall biosynthesis